MIYFLRPARAGAAVRSREDAAEILAYALVDHWENCDVYTIGEKCVANKIVTLYQQFYNLRRNYKNNTLADIQALRINKYNDDNEKKNCYIL